MLSDNKCSLKFRENVNVGISWNKKENTICVTFTNESDSAFFNIYGEFRYFNKLGRCLGGFPVGYKLLKPNASLIDNFFDIKISIPVSTKTISFYLGSVDCENPFLGRSVKESTSTGENDKTNFHSIFDNDLIDFQN